MELHRGGSIGFESTQRTGDDKRSGYSEFYFNIKVNLRPSVHLENTATNSDSNQNNVDTNSSSGNSSADNSPIIQAVAETNSVASPFTASTSNVVNIVNAGDMSPSSVHTNSSKSVSIIDSALKAAASLRYPRRVKLDNRGYEDLKCVVRPDKPMPDNLFDTKHLMAVSPKRNSLLSPHTVYGDPDFIPLSRSNYSVEKLPSVFQLELVSPQAIIQRDSQQSPAAPEDEKVVSEEPRKIAVPLPPEPLLKAGKILVCDDVSSNRKMLVEIIRRQGLECEQATDGTEAVEICEQRGMDYFSLIFMDNIMPVMSGTHATVKLRESGFKNLIVGVTGNSLEVDIKEYEDAGADMVITKPLRPVMLKKVLMFSSLKNAMQLQDATGEGINTDLKSWMLNS